MPVLFTVATCFDHKCHLKAKNCFKNTYKGSIQLFLIYCNN